MSERPAAPAPSLPRILALFLLLLLLNFWSGRHIGVSVVDQGWLAPAITLVLALAKLMDGAFRKEWPFKTERLGELLNQAAAVRVLVPAYAVTIVLMATCSSVTVIGASTAETGRVTLCPAEHPGCNRSKELGADLAPAQFRGVLTNPFGRTVRVDAPGYLPATFELFPVTGLTVRLGRDMPPAPAVLFRPPPSALGSLADPAARFRVELVGSRTQGVEGQGASAFLVGEDEPVPADVRAYWSLELQQLRDPDPAATLLKWMRPAVLAPPAPLAPGARLKAVVISRVGDTVAVASVKLPGGRFVDVPMAEVRR